MAARLHVGTGAVLLGIACAAVIAALVVSEPEIAWNSPARERLTDALSTIGRSLDVDSADASDFLPHTADNEAKSHPSEAKRLIEKYGIFVRWHRNGSFETLLFYPIAISPEIVIRPRSPAKPLPQIVMVPVDELDRVMLPNLHGCENSTFGKARESHLDRVKSRLSKYGIHNPVTLMSDGSVRAMPVRSWFPEKKENKRQADR